MARYLRMEEIVQSLRIIAQALEVPAGPVMADSASCNSCPSATIAMP
jgi:NADH:ubiquinone oxidoreductase subunit D